MITPLSDPPSRNDPGTFAFKADVFLGELPMFAEEANDLAVEVNDNALLASTAATTATTQANLAANSANLAAASANFKGAWNTLTGALNKPASVSHAGGLWLLLNNLANVTTSQPGVSADWFLDSGVQGPAVAVDNRLARYDGTTGKLLQDSSVVCLDNGDVGLGRDPLYTLDAHKPGTSLHGIAATNTSVISALMVAEARGQVGTLTSHPFYLLSGGAFRFMLDTSGNFLGVSPAGSIGYGVGAGGTVTQATSITTAVTLNKPTGRITTQSYPGGNVSFRLNNSLIAATDTVVATINPSNPGNFPDVTRFCVGNVNAGYCEFSLNCVQTGITFTINFSIIKGATA